MRPDFCLTRMQKAGQRLMGVYPAGDIAYANLTMRGPIRH